MDQLDLLKQEWNSREQNLPKLSYSEIYAMLLKKSSSVVKWIFIISIIEILFWIGVNFFIPESANQINEGMGLSKILTFVNVIHGTIFLGFIYLFYQNYVAIQITDSIKELMKKILKTRRTVRYFVYYNIGLAILISIAVNIYYYIDKEHLFELMQETVYKDNPALTLEKFTSIFFISQIVVGILFIGLIALIYYLVYGLLLRRLKHNYLELKKMDS